MEIKGTNIHLFFNLFWGLIKDFYQVEDSEEYFDRLQADIEVLCRQFNTGGKYEDKALHTFCCSCCMAYRTYIETKWKEKYRHGN